MKARLKKLYWSSVFITIIVTLVAISMMVRMKIQITRENLVEIMHAATAWTLESNDDLQSLAESIASIAPSMRVTFLHEAGLVLADSENDVHTLENHFDRPEFIEALDGVMGESLRISETQATLMFYVATRISPQLILRLSYPIEEITPLLMWYGGGLMLLLALLYVLQRIAISKFAGAAMRQVDDVRRLLDGDLTHPVAEFPEFQPVMNSIAYQVERLKGDLQEVNRTLSLRSDFVANASHELRSPLTSIMGFAEMLDEDIADTPEEQRLCVQMIRSECQRMLDVIEDILRLSKAERQKPDELQSVDVTAIASEICAALAPRAAQRDIELRVHGSMSVMALEKDVWEIIYNLADNAVRYGVAGGYVQIELSADRIIVRDDGIGIDKANLSRIFEQFYRVDETRDMQSGGTGLGLSIVRAIAQRYDGDVTVESQPGKGSCFTVQFGKPQEGQ